MAVLKCKMCGGDLNIEEGLTVAECEYCGSKQTVPIADNEKKMTLFARANRLRAACEFDKAAGVYESIVAEFPEEAEAYWGLLLCKFGIEYVDDPATGKKIPTCHRSSFDSIMDDSDFEQVMENADAISRRVYREEAKQIEELRKSIIEVSSKEEPYDIFICYKETDENGGRTIDSVIAQDVYDALTEKGYKVFFSRITLEDKLGQEYEPYIFAALNSAKVMLAFGTDYEYYNAVWVKNEWSRFLSLIAKGEKKTLIPCYKDIDAYDMPKEFKHLQAQDMGKVGAVQDLLRGINKIIPKDELKHTVNETVSFNSGSVNVAPFLKRGILALEDGEWEKANGFFDQALNNDAECAEAYVGLLMTELHVSHREDLADQKQPFDDNKNFKKAVRFGDERLKAELDGYITHIIERNKNEVYNRAVNMMNSAKMEDSYKQAAKVFRTIPDYKNAEDLANECLEKAETTRKNTIYDSAVRTMNTAKSESAFIKSAEAFKMIPGWKDADALAEECLEKAEIARKDEIYTTAIIYRDKETLAYLYKAEKEFGKIRGWRDTEEQLCICRKKIEEIEAKKEAEKDRLALVRKEISKYHNHIAVGSFHTVGLKEDGTVIASGAKRSINDNVNPSQGQCNIANWTNIIQVAAGSYFTVGLQANGRVVAVGNNESGQCDVGIGWTDISAIAANFFHTLGLKKDGTVLAVGNNENGMCKVTGWRDIVAIAAGGNHSVGLKSDGRVVAAGKGKYCEVSGWTDIVAIAAGYEHTVGLKADGKVVAVGSNFYGQCSVSKWKNIVAIAAGDHLTVGLTAEGQIVCTGEISYFISANDIQKKELYTRSFKNIIAIAAGETHIVGLKSDGTVVADGFRYNGQCDVSDWKLFRTDEEKAAYRAELNAEKNSLQTELSNLKGLFSGKRRKDIEARLSQIDNELKKLS